MYLIKYLIFLNLFFISLFANVQINIPKSIIKGDSVVFSIEASGNDIEFPKLSSINGNTIQELGSSTSTNIINSTITKKIKKTYSFYILNDFIFPSLTFVIDGKKVQTQEQEIKVLNAQKTKSKYFDLNISSSLDNLYVGENFILTVVFKYDKQLQIIDLAFENPNFENFWSKQLDNSKQYEEGSFIVQELKFLLFPLKEGLLKINPLKIKAQILDQNANSFSIFSNTRKVIRIYSNELNFNIKKLPSNTNLIGDFDIKSTIDKDKIKKGEAVSYKLEIVGYGNIDDIENKTLDILDATIYDNKPEVKTSFNDDKYFGRYSKTFSIIPSKSLVIPSINLSYYNKELNKVIYKKTNEFKIEVIEDSEKKVVEKLQKSKIKTLNKNEVIKTIEIISIKDRIIFFCLGAFSTLLIICLYFYVIKRTKKKDFKNTSLLKQVHKCKNKDELLKLLSVYIKINSNLDELIFLLEKDNDFILVKKDIIKILKKINL